LEIRPGDCQILIAFGRFGLRLHDVHLGNALELQLLPGVVQSLVGERQRLFVDARLLIGVNKVPVDVLDLGDGRNDLVLEGNVGNLLVVFSNAKKPQVRPEAKPGEAVPDELSAVEGIQLRRQSCCNVLFVVCRLLSKSNDTPVPVGKA